MNSNNHITIKDKDFELYISSDKIQHRIGEMASEINMKIGHKNPVFICVLNGSFFFASDLIKNFNHECEVTFVKLASYLGSGSSGKVKVLVGLSHQIKDRHIVIIEDIIDSGRTMKQMLELLSEHHPASISIVTLLFKESALEEDIHPDYFGFKVENKFLVGYGLDYFEIGRNLNDLYINNL